jgi:hypothetical protein
MKNIDLYGEHLLAKDWSTGFTLDVARDHNRMIGFISDDRAHRRYTLQQWSEQYSPVYYVDCQDCSLKPFFQSILRAMQVENLVGHKHTL